MGRRLDEGRRQRLAGEAALARLGERVARSASAVHRGRAVRGRRRVLRLLAAADPCEAFREEEAMRAVVVGLRHPSRRSLLLLFVIREGVGSLVTLQANRPTVRPTPPTPRRRDAAGSRQTLRGTARRATTAADGGEGGRDGGGQRRRRPPPKAPRERRPRGGAGRLGRARQPLGERHEGGAHFLRVGLIGPLVGLFLLRGSRFPPRVAASAQLWSATVTRASAGAPSAGGVAGAVAVQHIGDALFSSPSETAAGTVAPEEARRCSPPASSGRRGGLGRRAAGVAAARATCWHRSGLGDRSASLDRA